LPELANKLIVSNKFLERRKKYKANNHRHFYFLKILGAQYLTAQKIPFPLFSDAWMDEPVFNCAAAPKSYPQEVVAAAFGREVHAVQ
jgi:hypothetical protein